MNLPEPPAVIPTGSAALDALLDGGYPRGAIVELFGPASCGKTTVALHAVASAQREGSAAFVDAEHSLDITYAEAVGIHLEELLLVRPESGEHGLAIAGALAASRTVSLIAVDSVAALSPAMETELGAAAGAGAHERLLERELRKLAAACARSGTCLLLVNQVRSRPNQTETSTGGLALKLHAAVRIALARTAVERDGCRVHARVVKNRLGEAFREADFHIRYGAGITG